MVIKTTTYNEAESVKQNKSCTDTITGVAGADTLTGDLGDDDFVYLAVTNSAASVAANTTVTFDSITDFTPGADDLNIAAINVTLTGAGAATGIQAYLINLTGNTGALGTGSYLVVNNSNVTLTADDVMIAWTGTSQTPVGATDFILA